jgi:hypothetical protein
LQQATLRGCGCHCWRSLGGRTWRIGTVGTEVVEARLRLKWMWGTLAWLGSCRKCPAIGAS